jgi:hypothetical protein
VYFKELLCICPEDLSYTSISSEITLKRLQSNVVNYVACCTIYNLYRSDTGRYQKGKLCVFE